MRMRQPGLGDRPDAAQGVVLNYKFYKIRGQKPALAVSIRAAARRSTFVDKCLINRLPGTQIPLLSTD
jgi:hypothetical protein